MVRHTSGWAAVAAALMLVLAGCAGGVSSNPNGGDATTASGGDGGTVNFYISDQQNAIDQFEHLNVTVTEVTFVRADADADNETETEAESDDENESDDGGEQITYEIDNATVDLTELQGANASKLGSAPVPNGTYTKVFVEVSSVDGTLTDGSSADVKLPSNKLRLNKQFTVGNGEEVDFVFDVTVFERGNNGYILKPVAGESGTGEDVEIRDVDEDERDDADDGEGASENGESNAGDDETEETEEAETEAEEADESGNSDDASDSGQSSMNFYVSDEEHAMGDFEHLNVTITKVGFQRGGESGGWVEKDVDDRTVDLTTLMGPNATKLGTFGIENGTYTKVFVYVDDINGTLENGDSTRVKLPSNKLQLNTEFTVGNGEEVDFVYDMSVFKAGNSGKYILKPVVGESGTGDEVPIEDVDEDEDSDGDEASLDAAFLGNVSTGANATVEVTRNDSTVENATVTVTETIDGEETTETYETGDNGTVTFAVAENATELGVEVTAGGDEAELEREFETEEEDDADDADDDADDTADLNATFVGDVSTGANATVEVTRNGSAVENATVTVTQEVNGELAATTYATDANGTAAFGVDANATDLTVTVSADGDQVELEREFESDDESEATDDDTGNNGNGNGNSGNNGNGNAALRFVG